MSGPPAAGVEVSTDNGSTAFYGGDVPVGAVTAYFRDDVASLDDPNARIDGSIILPGKITQRTYPGGHYRYVVAIGDRHFTVTDDRYHDVDRPVGMRLPLASLHLFPKPKSTGGNHA